MEELIECWLRCWWCRCRVDQGYRSKLNCGCLKYTWSNSVVAEIHTQLTLNWYSSTLDHQLVDSWHDSHKYVSINTWWCVCENYSIVNQLLNRDVNQVLTEYPWRCWLSVDWDVEVTMEDRPRVSVNTELWMSFVHMIQLCCSRNLYPFQGGFLRSSGNSRNSRLLFL